MLNSTPLFSLPVTLSQSTRLKDFVSQACVSPQFPRILGLPNCANVL
jgi:hypothetical protein